jgi:O-antigen/teichoic acid export membrane protein
MLTFALPTLATAVVWLLMESTDALFLGHFQGADAVADFRAVLPVARLNQFVILSFGVLYTPLAARAFARDAREELSDLYWQTSTWIAVLTFPVFIMSCAFARPVVETLFGERYADSSTILAILAGGYFFHSALGFNGLTLKVFRKLRYSVTMDVSAAVLNLVLSLLLIPRFGAVGAAIGTSATMVTHNLLKQVGLWRYSGIPLFPRRYLHVYAGMLASAAIMVVVGLSIDVNVLVALPLGAVTSLAVVWMALGSLRLETTFPELVRLPVVRNVLRPFMRPM